MGVNNTIYPHQIPQHLRVGLAICFSVHVWLHVPDMVVVMVPMYATMVTSDPSTWSKCFKSQSRCLLHFLLQLQQYILNTSAVSDMMKKTNPPIFHL